MNFRFARHLLAQLAAGRRSQREVAAQLEPLGLTESQVLILWAIGEAQSAERTAPAQADLAYNLGISPPQVSNIVEQLRQGGYLDATRLPADRRRQSWLLTDAGRAMLSTALAVLETSDASCAAAPQIEEAA